MRWWILLLISLVTAPAVRAQGIDPVAQTDLFALYCIGAFDEGARRRASGPALCDANTAADVCKERSTNLNRLNNDDAYNRSRFERYLRRRTALSGERAQFIIAVSPGMREQGSTDLGVCLDTLAADFLKDLAASPCKTACAADYTTVECHACFANRAPAVCKPSNAVATRPCCRSNALAT
jgi:hypothetical protein